MNLLLIGISHKTAPLKVRERISFTSDGLKEALIELSRIDSVAGAVILFTCNRTEIYSQFKDGGSAIDKIKGFLFERFNVTENDIRHYFYILKNIDAIRHIFRVASGLDSQVLGENQILGQVRDSYRIAKDIKAINSFVDKLFKKAIAVGKTARLQTRISRGNISIGSVAIRMLEERFAELKNKSILIIGAGKFAALLARHLKKNEIKTIFVSNRNYRRAVKLATICEGEAVNFSRLNEKLKAVDIVISATASPHLILKKDHLTEIMQVRKQPLLIIDLGVPRDVSPEVKNISGISLYDLDDLKSTVDENYVKRKQEAKLVEEIIQRELEYFYDTGMQKNDVSHWLKRKQISAAAG